MRESYPRIQPAFEREGQKEQSPFYLAGVEKIMQHLLPPNFFIGDDIPQKLNRQLPIICWTPIKEPPFEISFFLCCHFRSDVFRFFYDMITSWLVPGKKLNAPLQFALDFTMSEISSQEYIAGQVCVKIESKADLETLQKNLPIIEKEIRLGVNSAYQASRILEIKGLSSDKKTALIQENLVILIKRRPQHFNYDILSEMQHFLVLCKDEFKAEREYRHLSRIIAVNYLFQKSLALSDEAYLDKRFVTIKLMRQTIAKKRNILGVIVAISFLRDNERLEGRHLASAIRKLVKHTTLVKGSFLFRNIHANKASTFYVEVEKKDNAHFTKEEVELLNESLSDEIQAHIEQSINPIFMPDNEEIILRNILTLSDQLKFVRDLPQVIITFKQQIGNKLEFLVVLVRVFKPIPISRFFELGESKVDFLFDRSKQVGYIRKKHAKEANVFSVQIPKTPYLRQDHSIDLYKGREFVTRELRHILGEFRDYNGGYMSKERELFLALTEELGVKAQKHAFLLENFFYSIMPTITRSTLEVPLIKAFFDMFLQIKNDSLGEEQHYSFHSKEIGKNYFIFISALRSTFKKTVLNTINNLKIDRERWVHFTLQEGGKSYFGFLLQRVQESEMVPLRLAVGRSLEEWDGKVLT